MSIEDVISGVKHHMEQGNCLGCPYFDICDDGLPVQRLTDDVLKYLEAYKERME